MGLVGWSVLYVRSRRLSQTVRERRGSLITNTATNIVSQAADVKFCFTYCDETYKAYSTFANLYFVICVSNENET